MKLRLKEIHTGGQGCNTRTISFQQLWWEPLCWAMCQLEWSIELDDRDKIGDRRAASITFLELACIIDVLSKGSVGPIGGSYSDKIAVIEYGIMELLRVLEVQPPSTKLRTNQFLRKIKRVESAGPFGFNHRSGLNRRPRLELVPGLTAATGTLLLYAHAHEKALDAKLPRYHWQGNCWRPDSMWQTYAQIAHLSRSGNGKLDVTLRPTPPQLATPTPPTHPVPPPTTTTGTVATTQPPTGNPPTNLPVD